MKKSEHFISIFIALALGVSSCSQERLTENSAVGRLALSVNTNAEVANPTTKSEESEQLPNVGDFKLELYEGDNLLNSWERFDLFEQNALFPKGNYSMKAFLGAIDEEGFESPYFEGIENFQIQTGELTQVSITARLANTKATIEYSEAFKKYFSEYKAKVSSPSSGEITFESHESRPAYFKPSELSVNIDVKNQQGTSSTIKAATVNNTLPQHHYRFRFDVDAGSSTLKVTFDTSTDQESVDIDISQEAMGAPAPTISNKGFIDGTTIEIYEGSNHAEPTLESFINARSGLASCILRTNSSFLQSHGWPTSIDLMNATQEEWAVLKGFGLQTKGISGVVENIAIVDFKEVIPNLMIESGDTDHTFTIEAVDKYSKSSTTTLTIRSIDNEFAILEPSEPITVGSISTTMSCRLLGSNFNLKAEALLQGEWKALDVNIISSESGTHNIQLDFPSLITPSTKVRLFAGAKQGETQLPIFIPEFDLKVNSPLDVYAGHADLELYCEDPIAMEYFKQSNIYAEYAPLGTQDWIRAEQIKIGQNVRLTLPVDSQQENSYTIRSILIDGETQKMGIESYEVTTERAAQLPNSSFEEWYEKMVWKKTIFLSGGESVYAFYPSASEATTFWASYNDKTTQPRGDASWFYCAYPGMVPTAKTSFTAANHLNRFDGKSLAIEAHSGENAMEIATVGWGKNNWTSASSASAEYKQAGRVYIGSYDRASQSETHGAPFASRPISLEFYYKYYSLAQESAKATVIIENADHQEIGRGELSITASTDIYTKANVDINYSIASKASFIRVEFLSTDSDTPQTKAIQGSKGAFNAGYGDSRHIGSVLTIDDVTLTY
ncbi:MAG: DUF4493 domain-containing protein [Bacteroidales bacterium]